MIRIIPTKMESFHEMNVLNHFSQTFKDFCPVMERIPKEDIIEELKDLIGLLKPLEAFAAYKKALDNGSVYYFNSLFFISVPS